MERPDELKANPDVRRLKAEISETQVELQQTVAEIQERLSPAHLKDQAADTMRDAATNVRDATIGRVEDMVRGQNPLPYALIGIGAAWLLAGNRSSRRWDGRRDYADYDASWNSSTSYRSSNDEFGAPYAGESSLRQTANDARQTASDLGRQAGHRARRAASEARSRWDMMLYDNPMAIGIAALAAGALVGAALPRTEVENEYMGDTRDSLVESARDMATDSVESAKSMAKETLQQVTGTGGGAQKSGTSGDGHAGASSPGTSAGLTTSGATASGSSSTGSTSGTSRPRAQR